MSGGKNHQSKTFGTEPNGTVNHRLTIPVDFNNDGESDALKTDDEFKN
jgi:hypothetical protein